MRLETFFCKYNTAGAKTRAKRALCMGEELSQVSKRFISTFRENAFSRCICAICVELFSLGLIFKSQEYFYFYIVPSP